MSGWREVQYLGWTAWEATTGELTIRVTPGVGGRIMSLCFRGVELLYQNTRWLGCVAQLQPELGWQQDKARIGFPLWGGSKVWLAPQGEWGLAMPSVDLDSGAYEVAVEGQVLRLKSPVCRETGIRVWRRIEVVEGGVHIEDKIENCGSKDRRKALWEVTMCWRPMQVMAPGSLQQWKAFPEEGESVALFEKVVSQDGEAVTVACERGEQFKVGAILRKGVVVSRRVVADSGVQFCREFESEEGGEYPHHGNVEVYNSPDHHYLEVEVLGSVTQLGPGDFAVLKQKWKVIEGMIGHFSSNNHD